MTKATKPLDDVAISVKNVSKYFAPNLAQRSIKQVVTSLFKRNKEKYSKDGYWAVDDVSFDIKKGEFFGIIGRNGSGKSTLLKMIAGVYAPTKGAVHVNGRLVPFIELGVGFNPELTGKDNVFLNGALLGFTRSEMLIMYDEIVEFAELEDHMEVKLKNFSSGMQVRLAFSIAIRAKADILLIDEVLAVGDYAFQQKCFDYFTMLKSTNKTVVFVSHDQSSLERFCTNGVIIDNGKVQKIGKIKDVVRVYQRIISSRIGKDLKVNKDNSSLELDGISSIDVTVANGSGARKRVFGLNEEMLITYKIKSIEQVNHPTIGLVIHESDGRPIFATNTIDTGTKLESISPNKDYLVTIRLKNVFGDGKYYISGAIASSDRSKYYARFMFYAGFNSVAWTEKTTKGLVHLDCRIANDL